MAQDAHQTHLTANDPLICCQVLCDSRGNPNDKIDSQALAAAHDFVQLHWQPEGQHEVRHRQEYRKFPKYL